MNVELAFLNANLEETGLKETDNVMIELGFEVFKLTNALLGLKRVPLAWYMNIDLKLSQMGFKSIING